MLFAIVATGFRLFCMWRNKETQTESLAKESIVLAIDVGSSSVRCSAFRVGEDTNDTKHIPSCTSTLPLHATNAKSADSIEEATTSVLRICIQRLESKGAVSIRAVGVATFAMSLVGVDKISGEALTPVFTYAGDASVLSSAQQLKSEHTPSELSRHYLNTGTVLYHPSYAMAQLRSFLNKTKIDGNRILWTSLSGYILGKWTNSVVPVSMSDAAWMGLLNAMTSNWDINSLNLLRLSSENFAKVSATNSISLQGLNIRKSLPILNQCLFFPGIADGFAASIGSYSFVKWDSSQHIHRIAVTIGTSAAARIVLFCEPEQVDDILLSCESAGGGLFAYRVSRNSIIVGGSLTDGGSLATWLRKIIGREKFVEALEELKKIYRSGEYVHLFHIS